MSRKKGEGQSHLKIVTTIDDAPGQNHIDPQSGQAKIFGITQHLMPPEFEQFSNFLNQRLATTERKLEASTEQSRRLTNSLEQILPKVLNQSVNQDEPDIVFAQLPEGEEADVAIADGSTVPAEAIYTLTTANIVERIGNKSMSASRMGRALRELGLYGNPQFHRCFKSGSKSKCQTYKPSVIKEIYKRLQQPELYNIGSDVVAKLKDYIKPKGV